MHTHLFIGAVQARSPGRQTRFMKGETPPLKPTADLIGCRGKPPRTIYLASTSATRYSRRRHDTMVPHPAIMFGFECYLSAIHYGTATARSYIIMQAQRSRRRDWQYAHAILDAEAT